MICKVLGGMAIILNQQNGTRGNLGVVIHEAHHLLHADGGKVLIMQTIHQLIEVMNADLVWISDSAFLNSVEHDWNDYRARRGIGGCPLRFEILACIVDVRMRRIQWIECAGGKHGR